jgi:hypothetical protein
MHGAETKQLDLSKSRIFAQFFSKAFAFTGLFFCKNLFLKAVHIH